MGRMSDLVVDIENLLYDHMDVNEIANTLDIPVEWVEAVAVTYEGEDIVDDAF